MSDSFVALAARGDESRITADDRSLRRFSGKLTKDTLPENGFGILKVALDEELHFIVGGCEIDDGHLATQAVQRVIAGGDDTAGGIQNEIAFGIFLEIRKDLVEDGNFFGEILGFAFEVRGAVWPAHPGGDAVNAGITTFGEDWREARFDLVVATDRWTTESGEIFGPVGFTGARHTNECET